MLMKDYQKSMRKHRQQKKIACLVTEKHENEATKPDTDKSREGAHESADISLCKSLYLLPKCTKTTKTVPKKRRPNARQSGFDAPSSEDNQRVISVERESEDASALSSEKSSTTGEKKKEDRIPRCLQVQLTDLQKKNRKKIQEWCNRDNAAKWSRDKNCKLLQLYQGKSNLL